MKFNEKLLLNYNGLIFSKNRRFINFTSLISFHHNNSVQTVKLIPLKNLLTLNGDFIRKVL